MKMPILMNVNYLMLLGTQKTIATMSQIHSLEKIILREMEVEFQDRLQETMETFTCEFNMSLSQEMNSIMSMTQHSQIIRARKSAIAERVIPEFQNNVSSMSSSGNRNTESGLSHRQQGSYSLHGDKSYRNPTANS